MNWQTRIIEAAKRIGASIRETPVEPSAHCAALYKLENLQHTGSFKFRGASNRIARLTPDEARAGVVTASNGNHGLAVAAAAKASGIGAEVFVSTKVSKSKLGLIERYGALIRQVGDDPLAAELAARDASIQSGRVFISPYNDEDVIAGQGTIGVELQKQVQQIDAVFVAAGGGGLIGGIGAYLKEVSPKTEIVGCWPKNSPVLYECMKANKIVNVSEEPTLSESTAGGLEPNSVTLEVCKHVIDRGVLVSEDEILHAMREVLTRDHWVVEGAAGVAVAAYLREAHKYEGKTVVVVICGRNVSESVLGKLI